ncbi:tyrosinase family protein [Azospirillum sp. B4]|uniref:tyrosinase family protein n=1 Tax=Azospirillum sp. B4 TaxID=95605 RepID=UPI00034B7F44|nr:tyrosinase family protein [Azospirillum sp. B4]
MRTLGSSAQLTRRAVLASGTAAALLPAAGRFARAAGPFVRAEISSQEGQKAAASYAKAIRAMLALPPDDPRNWYRQAMIHIIDCPHRNWWFLPWHRGYLWYLESIVRDLSKDPSFALPYWDWTANPQIPRQMCEDVLDPRNPAYLSGWNAFKTGYSAAVTSFYDSQKGYRKYWLQLRGYNHATDLLDAIQGAFFDRSQARDLTCSNPGLDPETKHLVSLENMTNVVLAPQQFESGGGGKTGFGSYRAVTHDQGTGEGPLESQPHDNVHGAIGGFMGEFMSPVDPIFYLHHANIDRVWTVWTAAQNAAKLPPLPTDAGWFSELFLFYVNAQKQQVASKAGDWVEPQDYSYTAGSTTGYRHPPPPSSRNLLVAGTLNIARIGTVAADMATAVASLPEATLPTAVNVKVAVPAGTAPTPVLVFVNAPDLTTNPTESNPGFLSRITFFGFRHHSHGSGSLTVQLPLPKRLIDAGLVKAGEPLNVQLIATTAKATSHGAHTLVNAPVTDVPPATSQLLSVEVVL